jgi:hypothetical protein
MPAWGKHMEDQYIWDVVAFVRKLHITVRSEQYQADGDGTRAAAIFRMEQASPPGIIVTRKATITRKGNEPIIAPHTITDHFVSRI